MAVATARPGSISFGDCGKRPVKLASTPPIVSLGIHAVTIETPPLRRRSVARAVGVVLLLVLGSGMGQVEIRQPRPIPSIGASIYLNAWNVEKEVLAKPLALQEWVDLGISPDDELDEVTREALKPKIAGFLAGRCPVSWGKAELAFSLERVHFIEPDATEFRIIAPESVVPAGEAMVSAVFAAPVPNLTEPVRLQWDLFPGATEPVEVVVADIAGSRLYTLDPGQARLSVRGRFLKDARKAPTPPPAPAKLTIKIPTLTVALLVVAIIIVIGILRSEKPGTVAIVLLVLCGGGAAGVKNVANVTISHPFKKEDPRTEDDDAFIVDRLLRGIYHAFNFSDAEAQYDVLAQVVDGDALTGLYLELRRTLASRQKDGARVRVNGLAMVEASTEPLDGRRGFRAECVWDASGRIGHWGHFHNRTNRYRARFVVEAVDETWKITGFTLLTRDRQIDPAT